VSYLYEKLRPIEQDGRLGKYAPIIEALIDLAASQDANRSALNVLVDLERLTHNPGVNRDFIAQSAAVWKRVRELLLVSR
jgi:hypothetical protein